MMKAPIYSLEQLLEIGSVWQKNEHGCEVSFFDRGESQTQQVSNEELTQRDSRLVNVLSHWHRKLALTKEVPLMHSDAILSTLAFWDASLWLTGNHGDVFAIATIDEVELDDHAEQTNVWFDAEVYVLDKAGEVTYATGKYEHMISVSIESLETQYPGWQTRLDITDSLDGGDFLYRTYVFSKTPVFAPTDSPLPNNMS